MSARLLTAALAALALAGPVQGKPALRDVAQIDDGLFTIGLAHEIDRNCPAIGARMLKGLGALQDLAREARALGYSDAEIRAHVESKEEKKRLRARAAEYMQSRGFGQSEDGYCALGRAEIAERTDVGAFLRARQ